MKGNLKYLIKFIVIVIISVLNISLKNIDDKIIWTENTRLLNYDDYKMEVPQNTDTLGVSNCGIEYDFNKYDKYVEVRVIAVFNLYKSWIRVKEDSVLIHEQGHFDICEITARKIRRDLIKYNNRVNEESIEEFIELIVSNLEKEHNENQTVYEKSMQGNDIQDYFTKMIKTEIDKLLDFKNHTVKIYYLKENN